MITVKRFAKGVLIASRIGASRTVLGVRRKFKDIAIFGGAEKIKPTICAIPIAGCSM